MRAPAAASARAPLTIRAAIALVDPFQGARRERRARTAVEGRRGRRPDFDLQSLRDGERDAKAQMPRAARIPLNLDSLRTLTLASRRAAKRFVTD